MVFAYHAKVRQKREDDCTQFLNWKRIGFAMVFVKSPTFKQLTKCNGLQ